MEKVWPGDVVVGDDEGVIIIPAHIVDEIVDKTVEMAAYEDFVTEKVLGDATMRSATQTIVEPKYHLRCC